MNENRITFLVFVAIVVPFILGVCLGLLMPEVQAQSQEFEKKPDIVYRVVGSNKDSTMERELNQLVAYGCRVVAATGAGYSEALAILECPVNAPSLH